MTWNAKQSLLGYYLIAIAIVCAFIGWTLIPAHADTGTNAGSQKDFFPFPTYSTPSYDANDPDYKELVELFKKLDANKYKMEKVVRQGDIITVNLEPLEPVGKVSRIRFSEPLQHTWNAAEQGSEANQPKHEYLKRDFTEANPSKKSEVFQYRVPCWAPPATQEDPNATLQINGFYTDSDDVATVYTDITIMKDSAHKNCTGTEKEPPARKNYTAHTYDGVLPGTDIEPAGPEPAPALEKPDLSFSSQSVAHHENLGVTLSKVDKRTNYVQFLIQRIKGESEWENFAEPIYETRTPKTPEFTYDWKVPCVHGEKKQPVRPGEYRLIVEILTPDRQREFNVKNFTIRQGSCPEWQKPVEPELTLSPLEVKQKETLTSTLTHIPKSATDLSYELKQNNKLVKKIGTYKHTGTNTVIRNWEVPCDVKESRNPPYTLEVDIKDGTKVLKHLSKSFILNKGECSAQPTPPPKPAKPATLTLTPNSVKQKEKLNIKIVNVPKTTNKLFLEVKQGDKTVTKLAPSNHNGRALFETPWIIPCNVKESGESPYSMIATFKNGEKLLSTAQAPFHVTKGECEPKPKPQPDPKPKPQPGEGDSGKPGTGDTPQPGTDKPAPEEEKFIAPKVSVNPSEVEQKQIINVKATGVTKNTKTVTFEVKAGQKRIHSFAPKENEGATRTAFWSVPCTVIPGNYDLVTTVTSDKGETKTTKTAFTITRGNCFDPPSLDVIYEGKEGALVVDQDKEFSITVRYEGYAKEMELSAHSDPIVLAKSTIKDGKLAKKFAVPACTLPAGHHSLRALFTGGLYDELAKRDLVVKKGNCPKINSVPPRRTSATATTTLTPTSKTTGSTGTGVLAQGTGLAKTGTPAALLFTLALISALAGIALVIRRQHS